MTRLWRQSGGDAPPHPSTDVSPSSGAGALHAQSRRYQGEHVRERSRRICGQRHSAGLQPVTSQMRRVKDVQVVSQAAGTEVSGTVFEATAPEVIQPPVGPPPSDWHSHRGQPGEFAHGGVGSWSASWRNARGLRRALAAHHPPGFTIPRVEPTRRATVVQSNWFVALEPTLTHGQRSAESSDRTGKRQKSEAIVLPHFLSHVM